MNDTKENNKANMYKNDYEAIRNYLENQQVKSINPRLEERSKYLEKFF